MTLPDFSGRIVPGFDFAVANVINLSAGGSETSWEIQKTLSVSTISSAMAA